MCLSFLERTSKSSYSQIFILFQDTFPTHSWHLEYYTFSTHCATTQPCYFVYFFKFSNHFLGFVVLLTLSQPSCRPISEAMSLRKFFLESQDESIGPHYAFRALYKYSVLRFSTCHYNYLFIFLHITRL